MPWPPTPEFTVGQLVRVVPSERHQTRRTGIVRQVFWHYKDGRYYFYIEENGKKVSTRYFAVDLEPVEATPAPPG
jgi:hypothetical protein